MSTKGVKNVQKICPHGLWMTPLLISLVLQTNPLCNNEQCEISGNWVFINFASSAQLKKKKRKTFQKALFKLIGSGNFFCCKIDSFVTSFQQQCLKEWCPEPDIFFKLFRYRKKICLGSGEIKNLYSKDKIFIIFTYVQYACTHGCRNVTIPLFILTLALW